MGQNPGILGKKKIRSSAGSHWEFQSKKKRGENLIFSPISFKFHYFPPKAADFQQLLPGGINKAGMKPEGRNIS